MSAVHDAEQRGQDARVDVKRQYRPQGRVTFPKDIPYSGLRASPSPSLPDQAPFGGVRFDKPEWNGLGSRQRSMGHGSIRRRRLRKIFL